MARLSHRTQEDVSLDTVWMRSPKCRSHTNVGPLGPAELVSPVLDYDNRGQWTKELRSIFNVIAKAPFSALPTEFCATQVHVSLVPDWTVSQIRSLAQAVLYYSEPFERLAERLKRSDKALVKPNRVAWGKATITEALQILDEASRAWDIVRLMNPRGPGVRLDRYCHWSFWPLVGLVVLKDRGVATTGDDGSADAYDDEARETMHKKLGTVEFRLPPGSRTVEEAIMWVDLANLFVRAAVQRTVP
ncbi:hypothetical protein F5Y15DRAFT_6240 [Xylariaceae sp. FL0016]|nr:hypothetical protein F5Y15DRAFT_6240 [Xylariaceae sp. FL0016]